MSNTVIKVENLSKKYILSHQNQERYTALRDVLTNGVKRLGQKILSPFGGPPSLQSGTQEEFYALRDVSFEIKQGDRVGIIGRNGAGKSTLLKILSRITDPTSGRVTIDGRVASLLEVGTGFHPELTGRENIYLNGAILGMSRFDIKRKFDEIVAFAEVEKFLDTPVKRYSSGMYVRLAFAVAAHLEPEILIVDEVLAVGDAQFQKKCLGKMESVGREGRTVLFVSHQMEAISNLCSTAILLQNGKIRIVDETRVVVDHYLQSGMELSANNLKDRRDRSGNGRLRFVDTWVEDSLGRRGVPVLSGEALTIVAEYEAVEDTKSSSILVAFAVSDKNGFQFTDLSNATTGETISIHSNGKNQIRCMIKRLPLNAGTYSYNAIMRSALGIEDFILNAGYFEVEAGDFFSSGKTVDQNQGLLLIDQEWLT